MKRLGILILLMLVVLSGATYAQEKKSKKERQQEQTERTLKMVEAQDYIFVPQHASPMSGRSIALTGGFDMRVSEDVIKAYLPYYGRVYTAPMDPAEGAIKFDSRDFDYRIENAKKGGWTVHITIKDAKRPARMILNITTSGSASLSVNDDTRQSISFNGYIEEQRPAGAQRQ